MKKLLALSIISASAMAFAFAASSPVQANGANEYAKSYCQFYKNKAKWTGDPMWWHRYYSCLKTYR